MRKLLLYYDEYHTPVAEYQSAASSTSDELRLLYVDMGDVIAYKHPVPAGAIVVDARVRFCNEQLAPLIQANGCYQRGYHLSAAVSRPLLARVCVEIALSLDAVCIIHGFAGNDALRFLTGVRSLAPQLQVESFAEKYGSRTRINRNGYTVSRNIAGLTVEAGDLERQETESDLSSLGEWLGLPEAAEISAQEHHILEFVNGLPASLDGQEMPLFELVSQLNLIGTHFRVGWRDMVEDGHVGYKTRAVYFAPAISILVEAHRDLERAVNSPSLNALKESLDIEWARLMYRGHAFDPALRSLDAFMRESGKGVCGQVSLHYAFSHCRIAARVTSCSVDTSLFAVYRAGQDFGFGLIEELSMLQALPAQADQTMLPNGAESLLSITRRRNA